MPKKEFVQVVFNLFETKQNSKVKCQDFVHAKEMFAIYIFYCNNHKPHKAWTLTIFFL